MLRVLQHHTLTTLRLTLRILRNLQLILWVVSSESGNLKTWITKTHTINLTVEMNNLLFLYTLQFKDAYHTLRYTFESAGNNVIKLSNILKICTQVFLDQFYFDVSVYFGSNESAIMMISAVSYVHYMYI